MTGLMRADATYIPLADASVDLIVTSPPYFALRSYQDDGEHFDGQMGSEATPTDFLCALWAVMDECYRVLKPSGSVWVNLGDKYAGGGGFSPDSPSNVARRSDTAHIQGNFTVSPTLRHRLKQGPTKNVDVRNKSLMGLPWRFALGLTCPELYRNPFEMHNFDTFPQWVLRAEVIWNKCLSGGAHVYARINGRVLTIKLHDLCRHYQPDDVQLWNGHRWTQVLAWEPTERDGNGLEIELRSGERIGCTPEHRWPVRGRGNVEAAHLAIGDIIETGPLPDGDDPAHIHDDIGWFVGAYLANGSRSGGTIQIAAHVNHDTRAKRLSAIAADYGETCNTYTTSENGVTINLTGRFLDAILATYIGGTDAYTKHLRPTTWSRSNRFLAAVLDGYLEGDGHTEPSGRIKIGFTGRNDALAMDLRTLAARLGHSIRLRRGTAVGFGRRWPTWNGTLYRDADRRKASDSQIVGIGMSRARRFWDIAVADDPHLFALASGVLTHNSNGLPESVTDRVRRSHEQWFHVTKQGRYFAAVDEVREQYDAPTATRTAGKALERHVSPIPGGAPHIADAATSMNPLGKLPGSVWTIPSEPLQVPAHLGVDHFAAFPQELPRRIILGWSPSGVCTVCGDGRRPVVEKERTGVTIRAIDASGARGMKGLRTAGGNRDAGNETWQATVATITGYACACPDTTAPTKPAVVLDPFGGTGTTAMVARALGRYGVHIDLSGDYLRLAKWRIEHSRHGSKSIARTNRERQGALW